MPDQQMVVAALAAAVVASGVVIAGARPRALTTLSVVSMAVALVWVDEAGPAVAAAAAVMVLAGARGGALTWATAAAASVVLAAQVPDAAPEALERVALVVGPLVAVGVWVAARRMGTTPAWVAVAAAAAACYVAVPDTEEVTVVAVAAAAIVPVVLADPDLHDDAPAAAAAGLAGLLVWACAAGAVGRPASFVVAPSTLAGVLVLAAACRRGTMRWRSPAGVVVMAAHLALAMVICRTAGLERSVAAAVALASVEAVVGGALLATVGRRLARHPAGRRAA